ncbi:MAG: hypothetical protein ABSG93_09100 [Solirubrobacteraceae bacterium]|jgi:DNA processing protein
MSARRYPLTVLLGLTLGLAGAAPAAAAPAPAGVQAGRAVPAATSSAGHGHGVSLCGVVELPVVGKVASELACEAAGGAAGEALGGAGGLLGEAAGAAGNSVMAGLAEWMIGAATQVTVFVSQEMQQTTTPQLQSAWYEAQFQPMADLGAALGLLVALIALASAAIRRNPQALAATLTGIARAGLGTGVVLALTVIALEIADQISAAVLTGSAHAFWGTVAHAWGTSSFGGFGSSALAALIALIEVFAAIFVWLELIVRDAAIYLAVLFFPAALAAGIWPALAAWPGRLGRLLLLFVILKPVALIVLSLAGSAAAAGLSFSSGVSGSVGTILAAIVIFALAAFAPWTLMYLLAADAESAYMAAGMRAATGAAVTSEHGRSVRNAAGLRDHSGGPGGGTLGGSSPGGGGSPGSGGGGDSPPSPGPSATGPGAAAAGEATSGAEDGGLPVGGENIGAGSIGAAAGINTQPAAAGTGNPRAAAGGPESQAAPAHDQADQAAGVAGETPSPGVLAALPDGPRGAERAAGPADAGGALTDASPPRPGSAGTPTPTPAGAGAPPSDGGSTGTLARSPRRRTTHRPLALVGGTTTGTPHVPPPGGSGGEHG